jgi:lysylphosphatidylglycerol synthetase-like protein (DUF2156 family)
VLKASHRKFVTLKKLFPMRYYINSGLFTVLILFFFLPFIEIKCNDSKLASMSGYDMITAGDIKMEDASMMEYMKNSEEFSLLDKQRKKQTDIISLAALILIVLGAVLSLVLKKFREETAIIIALVSIIILLIYRGIMLYQWDKQMSSQGDMFSYVRITLNFAIGFWLIVIGNSVITALNSFYLFQRRKQKADIIELNDSDSQDILEEV